MLLTAPAAAHYRRDLGNGLLLRWSTTSDSENIAHLAGLVFRHKEDEPPDARTMQDVRQLMSDRHPFMSSGDFALVEDIHKEGNPLVACACLWRHRWEYEGIPFAIGRPEIVASDPAYRHRGLIRALFELLHARSAAEGHLLQGITGIPYYYRQFGYEYALEFEGKRIIPLQCIPPAQGDECEAYQLRPATVEDVPSLLTFYHQRRTENAVYTLLPASYWQYIIEQPPEQRQAGIHMIIDRDGAAQGYILASAVIRSQELTVFSMEVAAGTNLLALLPPVLRALQAHGSQLPVRAPEHGPYKQIELRLQAKHPLYKALDKNLTPISQAPYAWYIRIPNLTGFIQHIAPALEQRLARSVVAGYTGELRLDFYRGGLSLDFQQGRLAAVEPWKAPIYSPNPGARIPALTFLKLLLGYRSLDELCHAFPDVIVGGEAAIVLNALFPRRPSQVEDLPIG
ncbi:GNAT family N-acetyltransferase [Ktedonosporobacter rubrisoli]|uniref:GNAT family N-acetyltransferase n=1 Tax=Ktedonosporobacter rubrisoli TaxID=2509675 RepID=A0A4P6K133_KTERU|nr:GNAT family N-acetyltransferase [Ktedonosporobacter rubrisoli]QBD81908.1 GNAT family N-acetyltransferase [Ktedonosporobacter rubrisoli]